MSCMVSRVRTAVAKSPAYMCGRDTVIVATYKCKADHAVVIEFCLDHTLLISKMSQYCAEDKCTEIAKQTKQEAVADVRESWKNCRPCNYRDEWHRKCTCIVVCNVAHRCHGVPI